MKILLTPDQESTLWHLTDTLISPTGERFYSFPFYMKPIGNGEYKRMIFEELPANVQEMILVQKGIKIPA